MWDFNTISTKMTHWDISQMMSLGSIWKNPEICEIETTKSMSMRDIILFFLSKNHKVYNIFL